MSFTKDPDAVLDYVWDWSDWLEDGEEIDSHEVIVPDGLSKDSDSANSTTVKVWLSGGEANTAYRVTCRVTTDNSPARVDDRSITINVTER